MTFGERIRIRREELGMSQEDLARKLGYKSRSTINKIELGVNDIGQSKIVAIAKALNTTIRYLFGDSEEHETLSSIKLSTQERELIKDYRSLSSQGQEYIRQTMYMAKNIYQEETYISNMENIKGA